MILPTQSATLAHVPKGSIVMLGGKARKVKGRPRPGFVTLKREDEEIHVRLRTKVGVLSSGKVLD